MQLAANLCTAVYNIGRADYPGVKGVSHTYMSDFVSN